MDYQDLLKAKLLNKKPPIEMIIISPDDFDFIIAGLTEHGSIIAPCAANDDGWRYLVVDFVGGIARETKMTVTDIGPGQVIMCDKTAPFLDWGKPEIQFEPDDFPVMPSPYRFGFKVQK
jgi:hypothetical protein